jgi:hypothetical protein
VVDLLENSIRVGFYLSDAKSYLAGDGKFIQWVEQHCKMSYARANQLHRLSKHFSRDLVDSQQRERLGITPTGLDVAIGQHVRNQISATGAKSLSDLFRCVGILPPLAIHDGTGSLRSNSARTTTMSAEVKLLIRQFSSPARATRGPGFSSIRRSALGKGESLRKLEIS